MTGTPGRDYTIEVWTNLDVHFAECTCGWELHHTIKPVFEIHVKNHVQTHNELGDTAEVI